MRKFKNCGVVIDRSWIEATPMTGWDFIGEGSFGDTKKLYVHFTLPDSTMSNRRIYSDEVPMAENPKCLRNVCFYPELDEDKANKCRYWYWRESIATQPHITQ